MSPSHYKVHLEFDQSILARLPLDGHSLATGQMYIATGQDRKYTGGAVVSVSDSQLTGCEFDSHYLTNLIHFIFFFLSLS